MQNVIKESWVDPATQFEKLYEIEFKKIFFLIRQIVPDEEDARNLTQETFTKAFKNKDRYVANNPPGAWLVMIGRNAALSHLRRRKVEEKYIGMFKEDMTTEGGIQRGERRVILARAMRFLNKEERQLIDLYYFKDMHQGMIADQLSISRAQVSRKLATAIGKMRIELGVE